VGLSELLGIGRSAIVASQTAMATINNNIANVNTPGYSRQDVMLELSLSVQRGGQLVGSGVTVAGIKRHYDRFIESQILGQNQVLGRATAFDKALSEMEQIFNDSSGLGLSKTLTEFFTAWQEVANYPEGQTPRLMLFNKTDALIRNATAIESSLTDNIKHINEEVANISGEINTFAEKIASLNSEIVVAETGSQTETAIGLRDQRQKLLSDLSNLANISMYENTDGSVNVSLGSRSLVSGSRYNIMSSKVNIEGNSDVYLDGTNITGNISSGQLGGFLMARQDITDNALYSIRRLVASVNKEVNLLHQAGFGLDSSTGLDYFNALQVSSLDNSTGADITSSSITNMSQLTLDEYDVTFDALGSYFVTDRQTGTVADTGIYTSGAAISFDGMQITITGAVTANDTFRVSPLTSSISNFGRAITDYKQIAVSGSAAGLPGDNANSIAMAQLAGSSIGDLGATFNDYYRSIVSYAGSSSSAASDSLTFETNMMTEMYSQRDAVSGVSLDEEAIKLIQFQRAFEAGARMVRIADEMMQTILQL
jgi:flagellar hook-associated protein 1 FlgK